MANARALALMKDINSVLKTEALTVASDKRFVVEYRSTGLLPFDIALGGGLPRGRFVTLIGDYSTLKSYVGLCAIAQAQARGEVCALIDTEHSFDESWARSIGVDTDSLLMAPEGSLQTGEQALDYAEMLIRRGCDLIVFDSIAAALPKAERNKALDDEKGPQMARLAYLMSVALRKLTAANSRTTIIWINQIRMNVGVTFGNPETQMGGKANPYYSSIMLDLRRTGFIKRTKKIHTGTAWTDSQEIIGQEFKVVRMKSKLSKPFEEVRFVWSLERGSIDHEKFVFAQGLMGGLITNKGAMWEVVGTGVKVKGKDNLLARLADDTKLTFDLQNKIRGIHGLEPIKGNPGSIRGESQPAKKKAASPNASKPRGAAQKSTPAPARGGSRPTRVIRKSSTR